MSVREQARGSRLHGNLGREVPKFECTHLDLSTDYVKHGKDLRRFRKLYRFAWVDTQIGVAPPYMTVQCLLYGARSNLGSSSMETVMPLRVATSYRAFEVLEEVAIDWNWLLLKICAARQTLQSMMPRPLRILEIQDATGHSQAEYEALFEDAAWGKRDKRPLFGGCEGELIKGA